MSSSEVYVPSGELNGVSGDLNGYADSQKTSNGLPPSQPGSSKASAPQSNGKVIMDYTSDFPELPGAKGGAPVSHGVSGYRQLTTANITATLKLSAGDRAVMNLDSKKSFGQIEAQKCATVATATKTKIELHESSDKSLTILITGKKQHVEEAQNRLVSELQTQTKVEISIDKEFYGALIGKEGAKRKQFENEFLCRLYLPGRDEQSNVVRIVGPSDKVKQAAHRLQTIVNELAKQATDSLEIPRAYYPWIRGPFNATLDRIQSENNVKVNIPPPKAKNETIVVSGERDGVAKAAQEIKSIYDEMKNNVKHLTVNIARPQHRHIMGHQRSGIDEIFKETNVIIDLPGEDDQSDSVTLRGPQNRLGDALSAVYTRASSIVSKELAYPEWQKRFLIGQKGANLSQLVPNQERLQIDFEDGKIYLEGPPETVKNAHAALNNEIERLTKEMDSVTLKVPVHLHRHLIGKQGSGIGKIKDEHDVQINIPNKSLESEIIRIEGNKTGVQKALAELKDQVSKLIKKMPTKEAEDKQIAEQKKANEERKLRSFKATLDIPRDVHQVIIGKGGATIRDLQQKYDVHVSIPRDESETITIQGYEDKTNAARQAIEKLVEDHQKQQEDRKLRSYKTSVDVPLEYHQRLIGAGGSTIRDLSKKYDVQIHIPRDQTETISIQGYENKSIEAREAIERLVQNYRDQITHEVSLNSNFHPRLIGQRGKNLKKMQEDYNVEIKFPSRQDEDQNRVLVSGLNEERIRDCIEKMQAMEDEYLDEYASHAQYQYKRPQAVQEQTKPQNVEIKGAPWQLSSMEQFPSMDTNGSAPQTQQQPNGVWGRRR